jgi:hypothetical protein
LTTKPGSRCQTYLPGNNARKQVARICQENARTCQENARKMPGKCKDYARKMQGKCLKMPGYYQTYLWVDGALNRLIDVRGQHIVAQLQHTTRSAAAAAAATVAAAAAAAASNAQR